MAAAIASLSFWLDENRTRRPRKPLSSQWCRNKNARWPHLRRCFCGYWTTVGFLAASGAPSAHLRNFDIARPPILGEFSLETHVMLALRFFTCSQAECNLMLESSFRSIAVWISGDRSIPMSRTSANLPLFANLERVLKKNGNRPAAWGINVLL
jgi:hypothetical protein